MSNLNPSGRLLLLLLLPAAAAVLCIFFANCVAGGGGAEVQWQILTKLNYSSQIRLHPRLILLVTIPWSGESRSLMKELAHAVANDDMKFGPLKLMVLYKNIERALADALGATDEITFFYYQNTLSYKYQGRLRVQNILSSVQYVMSSTPNELPFKSVTTPEELRNFVNSTDKAVFLLEFCGWTSRLLAMNETMTGTDLGKGNLVAGYKENSEALVGEEKDAVKGMESGKWICDIDEGFSGIPWTDQFNLANDSHAKEDENMKCTCGNLCAKYEYHQFEVFFEKLLMIAREFFLPPERVRFAVIRERSLLPLLHIQEPVSWLLTIYVSGCPSCSKVLNEVDDLKNAMQTQVSPVVELDTTPHDAEIALPAKRPALLLFVDRSSNSVQIRRQSQEALEAFKELAQRTETSNLSHGQASLRSDRTPTENKHPKLPPFSASQNLIIQDKMSVMVMNEGQQFTLENIAPDLQAGSVQDILNYVLNQKNKLELSALAKDKGFQLLSEDFDVDAVESLPPASADQSNQGSGEPMEGGVESANHDEKQMPAVSSSNLHDVLMSDPSDVQHNKVEHKEESSDTNSLPSVEPEYTHLGADTADASAQGWNDGETSRSEFVQQQEYFTGSFFVCDGQYRLLEILTGGSKMPSVVIVDPISQEHYVLNERATLNHSLLSVSVNDFLAGKLQPYTKSSATIPGLRDGPRPPFVNLDFHETDSIPVVNAHTFSELILGNRSDLKSCGHHRDRNVLILFSNSWCGFCLRMELVVREVYHTVKAYTSTMITSSAKEKSMLIGGYVEDAPSNLPLIYMMDCTQNDCGPIIKTIGQRELYPQLLLFPADRKNIMPYEGDIAVSDIIKFLAAHGSHVLDLIMDKSSQQDKTVVERNPLSRTSPHEVLLKERSQNNYQTNTQLPINLHERPQLFPGSILLASEKLLDAHPFEESKILIVKADQTTGFRGLIFNKPINWDSAEEFVQGLEPLKDAPLSFGGPVVKRGMPLVALTRKFIERQSVEVLPNVYFVDQSGVSWLVEDIRSGNQSVHDYWFFLGYSSWGWEQMFLEIAQGAWNVSQGSLEQLEWP